MRDDEAMKRALALGARARRRSVPNPWVGCVVVRDGAVVGEGISAPPGGPHAEVEAMRAAGDRARGATAVVTLEPCAHLGRTGPCAEMLVDGGVARVVVALEDPDPRVAGRGLACLRDAGIEVVVGPGAAEARASLAPYLHHRRTGRAYCLVKSATSLDGRVATATGESRWITGAPARWDAHELRALSQAVVVGAGTAIADRPALTVRHVEAPPHPPLRVVLDAAGRVPALGPLFDPALAPTLVCTTEAVAPGTVEAWKEAGAEVVTVPAGPSGVDPVAVLEHLGGEGVVQALVEGGPTLHASLVGAGLVDRMVVHQAPLALGAGAMPMLAGWDAADLDAAPRFTVVAFDRLGDDLRIELEPC